MRFRDVYKVLSIGSHIEAVMVGRVGQSAVRFAGEIDDVQLQLHQVLTVGRGIEQPLPRLIHMDDLRNLEFMIRQRRQKLSGEIVEIKISPTSAFRRPDEALAILEEA